MSANDEPYKEHTILEFECENALIVEETERVGGVSFEIPVDNTEETIAVGITRLVVDM